MSCLELVREEQGVLVGGQHAGGQLCTAPHAGSLKPCLLLPRRVQAGERYVLEWLRQQASARIIQTDAAAEKFWLTPAQQVGRCGSA